MRWPWRRSRAGEPSEDAQAAAEHVRRAMVDTDRLIEHIDEVAARAHRAADASETIRARNHIADAVVEAIARKVRHP